jgi:hypothetical protein
MAESIRMISSKTGCRERLEEIRGEVEVGSGVFLKLLIATG